MSGTEKTAWRLGLTRAEISLIAMLIGFLLLGGILKNFRSTEKEAVLLKNARQARLQEAEVDSLIRLATLEQANVSEEVLEESAPEKEDAGRQKSAGREAVKKLFSGTIAFNKAGKAQLQQVPGIGPVMAERLIAFRAQKGGRVADFRDFLAVKGIAEKKLEILKKHFTLD
ncbi:MAG: helix-hairpin-helix domain-containing protein [Chlorobiaceae bacterium]|nr:helix-hairpin-helix domain-containing protein [Chlorobiaceae bacterium]